MINEAELSKKTIFSFEVFPPKKTMPIDSVFSTLDELKDLNPDFISVTFGAGGSENCDNSIAIAKRIKDVCHVEPVIHMPCLNMTRADAKFVLEQFRQAGIENILALRGDKVEGKERGFRNGYISYTAFSKAIADSSAIRTKPLEHTIKAIIENKGYEELGFTKAPVTGEDLTHPSLIYGVKGLGLNVDNYEEMQR